MNIRLFRFAAAAALALPLLAGCRADDESPLAPVPTPIPQAGGELFVRYVAMGNSITAGLQSGGLLANLQVESYASLLAKRAGAQFYVPLLAGPGCPQPFTAPLVAPPAAPVGSPCFLVNPLPEQPVGRNLAVPGARIQDLLVVPQNQYLPLYRLITRGVPEVQAMTEADPTFVSVWAGNNDALAAALGGNLGPAVVGGDSTLTPLASFQASLNAMVSAIKSTKTKGAALIGVVDAMTAAPLIQPGAYFFLAATADAPANPLSPRRYNGKLVSPTCSPQTATGAPNPLSANMVSMQIVGDANFPEINCDPNAYPQGDPRRGAYLLDTAEQTIVGARVAAYNAAIKAAASANGWVYLDPNVEFAPFINQTDAQGRYQNSRKCQALPAALASGNADLVQAAVLTSCPVPPTGPTAPYAAPNFFGALVSFDGTHPSATAHVIVANALAREINTKYGTKLATN